MCIYTHRSICTQARSCSTCCSLYLCACTRDLYTPCCSLYLYKCTRNVDSKSHSSSSSSDGANQHAGHSCSTSCSSNWLYASKGASESQAHDSKSHSSASEGARQSEALDSKAESHSSAQQRKLQLYHNQPTTLANFQRKLNSICALTAKPIQA